jgi:hypothetical protein
MGLTFALFSAKTSTSGIIGVKQGEMVIFATLGQEKCSRNRISKLKKSICFWVSAHLSSKRVKVGPQAIIACWSLIHRD